MSEDPHGQTLEAIAIALWGAEEGSRVDWSETNDWWRDKYRRSAEAVLPVMAEALRDLAEALAPGRLAWVRKAELISYANALIALEDPQ